MKTDNKSFLSVEIENFGPIESGSVRVNPLTIFIGRNASGKTYLSLLIYMWIEVLNRLKYRIPKESIFFDRLESELVQKLPAGYIIPGDKIELKISGFNEFMEKFFSNAKFLFELFESVFECELSELITYSKESAKISYKLRGEKAAVRISYTILRDGETPEPEIKIEEGIDSLRVTLDYKDEENFKIYIDDLPLSEKVFMREPVDRRSILNLIRPLFIEYIKKIFSIKEAVFFPSFRSGLILSSYRLLAAELIHPEGYDGRDLKGKHLLTRSLLSMLIEMSMEKEISKDNMELIKFVQDNILRGRLDFEDTGTLLQIPEIVFKKDNYEMKLVRSAAMHSELAPIILYLMYEYHPDTVLFIDEPEAHLYPGAQREIARLFARIIHKGNHMVIATHSDYLFSQINNLVLLGSLDEKQRKELFERNNWNYDSGEDFITKEDVNVYKFVQIDGTETYKVEPVETDENGFIEDEFVDIVLDSVNQRGEILDVLDKEKSNE